MLLLDTLGEPVTELLSERTGLVVTGAGVGGHDDRAEVAEIELGEDAQRVVGLVAPLGGTELGEQTLGQGDEFVTVDLGEALSLVELVLLVDGLADCRDTAAEHVLGDRALLGRKRVEHGVAVGATGTEALGAGLGLGGGATRAIAAGATRASVTTGTVAVAAGTITIAARTVAVAAGAVAPVTTIAVTAATPALGGEGLGHERLVLAGADDLERLELVLAGVLGREDRQDVDAVDEDVGVGPQDVTDLRAFGELRGLDLTLGHLRPCLAPGPHPIGAGAGQFDFKPGRHRGPNLTGGGGFPGNGS